LLEKCEIELWLCSADWKEKHIGGRSYRSNRKHTTASTIEGNQIQDGIG